MLSVLYIRTSRRQRPCAAPARPCREKLPIGRGSTTGLVMALDQVLGLALLVELRLLGNNNPFESRRSNS